MLNELVESDHSTSILSTGDVEFKSKEKNYNWKH